MNILSQIRKIQHQIQNQIKKNISPTFRPETSPWMLNMWGEPFPLYSPEGEEALSLVQMGEIAGAKEGGRPVPSNWVFWGEFEEDDTFGYY